MWEITLFDEGLEIGTFDLSEGPEVGKVFTDVHGSFRVVNVRSLDSESRVAEVDIEYVF